MKFFTKAVSPLISQTFAFLTLSALCFIFSFISLSFLSNSVSCVCSGIHSGMLFLILLECGSPFLVSCLNGSVTVA